MFLTCSNAYFTNKGQTCFRFNVVRMSLPCVQNQLEKMKHEDRIVGYCVSSQTAVRHAVIVWVKSERQQDIASIALHLQQKCLRANHVMSVFLYIDIF